VFLCEAGQGHLHVLRSTPVGEVLRPASPEDLRTADRLEGMRHRLFEAARKACQELRLPLQVLDAEILLDGRHAVLHYLQGRAGDPARLFQALDEHGLAISLQDLALPEEPDELTGFASCGSGGCGSGSGCGTCGSGGCSSCGGHGARQQCADGAASAEPTVAVESRRIPLYSSDAVDVY
jgi:hypothetical protein